MRKIAGFALVELLLILVVVGILGFVAWRVVLQGEPTTTAQDSTVIEESESATPVQETKDLDTLSEEMDTADLEGSTIVDLESETAF